MLKKYIRDAGYIILDYRNLEIQSYASYVEEAMKILNQGEKVFLTKRILLVKNSMEKPGWESILFLIKIVLDNILYYEVCSNLMKKWVWS